MEYIFLVVFVVVIYFTFFRSNRQPSKNQHKTSANNHKSGNGNILNQEAVTGDERKLLRNFFKVDITTIRPNENGEPLILDNPELGCFDYVNFYLNPDGSVHNIEFISLSKNFSKELIEFINICAKKFGPTKSGETIITARDYKLLSMGMFSRLWDNVWFDVSPDEETGLRALRLTIFNVKETANTQLR